MVWTQGRIYDFHDGDMFYDTALAYEDFDAALKTMRLCVTIQDASPSTYAASTKFSVKGEPLEITPKTVKPEPKDAPVYELNVTRYRVRQGWVRFKVYRPNPERTGLQEFEVIDCTQESFVAFLQTGVVRTKDKLLVDLFADALTAESLLRE